MWCFHDRLKQFTFSNGEEIKCCVDCTTFDNKRIEVLRVGTVEITKTPQEETHWRFLLEEAGLSDQLAGNHLVDNGGSLQDLAKLLTNAHYLPEYFEGVRFIHVLPTLKKLYD